MRPLPGEDSSPGRSRSFSSDNDLTTPLAPLHSQTPQMSYFIADERTMEASLPRSASEERLRTARHNFKKGLGLPLARTAEEDVDSYSESPILASRPFTPLSFGSPGPRSALGSPDSRRGSDFGSYTLDDASSQAVLSSEEDEGIDAEKEMLDSGSAPQLVMPSIKMPSRRPFTDRGKSMGRFKVMVAGAAGVGKTSLIKAIVQSCEDIVHVDPLSPTPSTPTEQRRRTRTRSKGSNGVDMPSTSRVTEIYASTRAYPAWWSDLEDSRVLRRRKSMGDSVLERNLCFIDTPGYGNRTSCLECITPVVDYIESQYRKATTLDNASESDMVNMLCGNGGSQVDLVIYTIKQEIKPVDLEYLQRLAQVTNVVPVICFSDTLSQGEMSDLKESIRSELHKSDIKYFTGLGSAAPFAISTCPSKELESMDASLLMSPDYVQPLFASELTEFVSRVFEPETLSWLRHLAGKKFVQWRASSTPTSKPQSLYRPLTAFDNSLQCITAPVGATSYALARISDHTQREGRMAQVRLANWAADLQRSLCNERKRYDALARNERAVWLTERLGECVQDGTIIPLSEARKDQKFDPESHALMRKCAYQQQSRHEMGLDRHDPLGLLQLNIELQRKAWLLVKVVGSFGIVGGFAYWLVKNIRGEEVAVWGMGGLTVRDMVDLEMLNWR